MKKNIRLKLTSLLVALVTMFSFTTTPVMAAPKPVLVANTMESGKSMEELNEVAELRQKLNTALGETASTTADYKTDYWGYCTVTNTHTGGYHTIYGHQARLCVAVKPLDGNTALSFHCNSFINLNTFYRYNAVDADGYSIHVTDWVPVNYMGSYNINYRVWTTGDYSLDGRIAKFHVWVDYK